MLRPLTILICLNSILDIKLESYGAPKMGNTTGIPPRTGLEPSRAAFDETKRCSQNSFDSGFGAFQEITVAP